MLWAFKSSEDPGVLFSSEIGPRSLVNVPRNDYITRSQAATSSCCLRDGASEKAAQKASVGCTETAADRNVNSPRAS